MEVLKRRAIEIRAVYIGQGIGRGLEAVVGVEWGEPCEGEGGRGGEKGLLSSKAIA